jgi:hypothetical protein
MNTTDSVLPGHPCQADGCEQSGSAGGPVQHGTSPVPAEIHGMKIRVYLCPTHRDELKGLREPKSK